MAKYPHISTEASWMQDHYDVVVVGSGYGGGIAASRMARAGRKVALLERGKERWPGEYPVSQREVFGEVQYHGRHHNVGPSSAMFHVYHGDGQNALVGCGLGGTSLINANVALPADRLVWEQKNVWPEEILQDYKNGELQKAQELAETMLEPKQYPSDWPELPKFKAFERQAQALGKEIFQNFKRAPITVHFENRVNNAGVRQKASTLSGDDCTGVNDGSKNTTLMNYIPDAWNHGAEIFCEVEVQKVIKNKKTGKWVVYYEWVGGRREHFGGTCDRGLMFVTADVVFLAAGTLGTNEIMLRSKAHGLSVSNLLGERFSGNGDIVGWAYNTEDYCNGVAMGSRNRKKFKAPVGPCITGILDMRHDVDNVMKGFVIEEGTCPYALASTYINTMNALAPAVGTAASINLKKRSAKWWRGLVTTLMGPYSGALAHSQTFLAMSHDDCGGELELKDDRLVVNFRGVAKTERVKFVNEFMAKMATARGGTYVPSPLWHDLVKKSLATVHPLGGCSMGKNNSIGVVNHKGQVFKGDVEEITETHEGLYICDGSIIPTALGVNPFLTISTLAERICALAANDHNWNIDYTLPAAPINFKKPKCNHPESPITKRKRTSMHSSKEGGLMFTEVMKGYFSTEVTVKNSHIIAETQAKTSDSTMQFFLTVVAYEYDSLSEIDSHAADINGTVACRALSPDPLLVTGGAFRVCVDDDARIDSKRMKYRMELLATDGTRYLFDGYKVVFNANLLESWSQTSTLYVTVYEYTEMSLLEEVETPIIGQGVLRIRPFDFVKQLTTMKATGSTSRARNQTRLTFFRYFVQNIFEHYVPIVLPYEYPDDLPVVHNASRISVRKVRHTFVSKDGTECKLVRCYVPNHTYKAPVVLIHGTAMTHEMWTTDLLKLNIVDYLLDREFEVWLIDYRLSPDVKAHKKQCTLEDCKSDIAAGIKKVRELSGARKVGVIAHCVGAIVTFMGLLDGSIEGVGSLIASQVAMHPEMPLINKFKYYGGLFHLWTYILRQKHFDVKTHRSTDWLNSCINFASRFYPVGKGQCCRSAVCHRASFSYGLLWRHENVSEAIHNHCDEFFGSVNSTFMSQLLKVCAHGKILDSKGDDTLVTEANIKERLKFPIAFIHGELNAVFPAKNTKCSFNLLQDINGPDLYERFEVDNYGHIDSFWATSAPEKTFPWIVRRLEATKEYFCYSTHTKQDSGYADVIHAESSKKA